DAPAGKWRNAQTPPSVSAKAISAPPWRTPPVVQRSGAHGSVPRTLSGSAETISIPSRPASGTDAARSCSANPQRPPAGLAHLRHPFGREPAWEPVPELREELVRVPAPVGLKELARVPRPQDVHSASVDEEALARDLLRLVGAEGDHDRGDVRRIHRVEPLRRLRDLAEGRLGHPRAGVRGQAVDGDAVAGELLRRDDREAGDRRLRRAVVRL